MLREISLHDIADDDEYRVTRRYGDRLLRSIKQSGILIPPVLLEKEKTLKILFGHNRISLAKTCSFAVINAYIMKKFDPRYFAGEILKKDFHDLLGPAGKLKSLKILHDEGADPELIESLGEKLSINEFYRADVSRIHEFLALPARLLAVIDSKSLPYKTIRLLHEMDANAVSGLAEIVNAVPFKMNYIRELIEVIYDISRMQPLSECMEEALQRAGSGKVRDEDIISYFNSQRNPEYMKLKDESDALKKTFLHNGVELEYPPYFEGSEVCVKIKISRRDKGASFAKGRAFLEKIDIEEVLKYL
jgi:hypothetical protein